MRRVGIGYRAPLAAWIATRPSVIGCLEITAEHFFNESQHRLRELRDYYPLLVHGLGLSLGTPGALDQHYLRQFAEVCRQAKPLWISDHIAFTRSAEVDLGHLNPIRCTPQTLTLFADHVREVTEHCGYRLILENITSHLRLPASLSETEFINRLCEQSGCGLLLDVTNLYINSVNHGFDAIEWFRDIDPHQIVQLHVVGYAAAGSRLEDHHAHAIQTEILELLEHVLAYAPVQAVILERDAAFPSSDELEQELKQLEAALARH